MLSKLTTAAIRLALALAILIPLTGALTACNTTAGAGQDISATGHAITHDAEAAKP